MTKVRVIDSRFGLDDETPFCIASERDQKRLKGYSASIEGNLGMIVLDPISQAVDGDFNNEVKAREGYERLSRLAAELNCAIVGVCHTVKNPRGKDPLARIAGPRALSQVPRSLILLSKIRGAPTKNGGTHVLVRAKGSESGERGGFEYCLPVCSTFEGTERTRTVSFETTGELSGTAEEILAFADAASSPKQDFKTDIAKRFLQEVLSKGAMLREEIDRLATSAGIAIGTLNLASTQLQIEKRKGPGGKFTWRLLDSDPGSDSPSREA